MKMFNPMSPVEFITTVYLKPLNLSVRSCAEQMGVSPSTLNRIFNDRGKISPAMAQRLSKTLGGSVESWIALQSLYGRWQERLRNAA